MNNYLLLSLGHNSSAIFVDNSGPEQKIIGYEQERLSGIKADSQFPRDAINEIAKHVDVQNFRNSKVLISHWFNTSHALPNKYVTKQDLEWLNDYFRGVSAVCSSDFTHHDAHAYSAYEFFRYHTNKRGIDANNAICLVADGFGNDEEVISLYSSDIKGPHLIHRVYGYEASLGLMYQYATSFVGMKENQDEYKFLGYEAHIDSNDSFMNQPMDAEQIDVLNHYVDTYKERLIEIFTKNVNKPKEHNFGHNVIDTSKLNNVKLYWYCVFKEVLKAVGISDNKSETSKCVIAYFIQQLCENTLISWLRSLNIKIENLIVAGGVFYNVKLNQALAETCASKYFSVMPLAGDQGAAIGMYAKDCDRQFEFGNLCWGKRNFYNAAKIIEAKKKSLPNIKFCDACGESKSSECESVESLQKEIARLIADGNLVNIVTSSMEFGPRALCHTSTLFLPTAENIHFNNTMNGRNEVMPCAPVCMRENAAALFETSVKKVIGSDDYMICTHTYTKQFSNHYAGVMHKLPLEDKYTGRPQLVDNDNFMYGILSIVERMTDYKALVNTSFNVHGRPIAFSISDILQNYEYQCEHSVKGKEPYLFIINI